MKGLGNNQKKNTSIKATFRKCCPDIVLIQETKKGFINKKCLASFWGRHNYNWTDIPSNGATGGLFIAWKNDFFDIVTAEHGIFSCLWN